MAKGKNSARSVTITRQAITIGDVIYPLSGLVRVRRGRMATDGHWLKIATGLTAMLTILAAVALLNGLVPHGLALALAAVGCGAVRRRLRTAPLWTLRLETKSRVREIITSDHQGAMERLATLLRDAIEGELTVTSATVDLDLGTVDLHAPSPSAATASILAPEPVTVREHPTRWHRPTTGSPEGLEDELAVFSREVRASFAEDDWESERVLLLLESEIVSPSPRHRLAENLWKEIRAAAPRTGRLEAEFRRLLDWPRGMAA